MRIGILTRSMPPFVCGVADHSVRLAEALRAGGDDVLLFALRGDAASGTVIVGDTLGGDWTKTTMAVLESHNIEHLVLQFTPLAFSDGKWRRDRTLAAFWKLACARWPTSLIVHETYYRTWRHPPSLLRGSGQKTNLRSMARSAHFVFSASELLVDEMAGWNVRRQPVRLPIGSNTPVAIADVAALRHTYALSDECIVLTLFGCGNNLKKMRRHVDALARKLDTCGIQHSWLLLGGVSRDLIGGDRVVVSPGWLAPEELSAHLQMTDLFLMPHFGGISAKRGTLVTALAHGLPVIGTDGFMTDPLLRNLEGVVLVDEKFPDRFSDAALQHCHDQDKRRTMRRRNEEYYRETLTWPIISDRFSNEIGGTMRQA